MDEDFHVQIYCIDMLRSKSTDHIFMSARLIKYTSVSQLCVLREHFWCELHSGLHISLNLHLTFHESLISVKFACSHKHDVVVEHHEGAVWLDPSNFTFLSHAVSVFKINSEEGWLGSLLLSDLEKIDGLKLVNNRLSLFWMSLHEVVHLLEERGGFKWH